MSARPLTPPMTQFLPAQLPPVSRLLVDVALVIAHWETRLRGRRALAQLDDHLLRDIGIDAQVAEVEATKPFWRD